MTKSGIHIHPFTKNLRKANSLLLVLSLVVLIIPGFWQKTAAQSKVDILKANRIEGGKVDGDRVQKILGQVHLKSKNLEMFCDSAYKFVNKSKIRAFGNIQINTKTEKIWTDTLTYLTDIDFSKLRGRVIIRTDTTTLFGNSVDYRFSTKIAHFIDKIRLEDERGTLLANSGFYYRQADSAEFIGDVQLSDSLKYLEGDSLYSNRRTESYEIYGSVFGDDRENKTLIKGDYLESDSTGRRLLEGKAWLKNYKQDSTSSDTSRADSLETSHPDSTTSPIIPDSLQAFRTDSTLTASDSLQTVQRDTSQNSQPDTTHIRAKKILSLQNRTRNDTTTTVKSYENVRIWSSKFSAVSDSAWYKSKNRTFELWVNAKAWHDHVQLSGPYIYTKLRNGDIDSLKSHPRPFSVQQDTAIQRLNQITGDTLEANFTNGNLSQIHVFGNSHLLRFTKNSADSADGAIELTAPTIQILFANGEIDSMRAVGAISGSYLPENKQTAEKKLEGFLWNPKQRPTRPQEKMQRRLPPIPKDLFFKLPERYVEFLRKNEPQNTRLDSLKENTHAPEK